MTTPAPVFTAARRPRTPLTLDLERGTVAAGGQKVTFDPSAEDAPYLAYLRLVRRLRDVHREPSFVLRRDDVEALARALRQDAVVVLDRLGALMGASVIQRRTMVTAFAAGAVLIAVAGGAAALVPSDGRDDASNAVSPTDTPDASGQDAAAAGPSASPAAPPRPSAPSRPSAPGRVPTASEDPSSGSDQAAAAASPAPAPATASAPAATSAPAASPSPAPPAPVAAPAPAPSAPAPPAPADPPPTSEQPVSPAPDPGAPGAGGERDGWSWPDEIEVVQPGADIDIPDDAPAPPADPADPVDPADPADTADPSATQRNGWSWPVEIEVVQPGADIDIPGDDPDAAADDAADGAIAS